MNRVYIILSLFILPLFYLNAIQTEFNFSTGNQGWVGEFSDYPEGEEAFFELAWGWENIADSKKGLFLSGNNHSDDLFMFLKRQISSLEPNTLYALSFLIEIESAIAPGLIGIGGSPGESLFFKVGAAGEEPVKVAKAGHYFLSVDKGNQGQGGANAQVIGDLANPKVDPINPHYAPKELKNEAPLLVKSDGKGCLWLFLGTDSGFEGSTKFYITKIAITLLDQN